MKIFNRDKKIKTKKPFPLSKKLEIIEPIIRGWPSYLVETHSVRSYLMKKLAPTECTFSRYGTGFGVQYPVRWKGMSDKERKKCLIKCLKDQLDYIIVSTEERVEQEVCFWKEERRLDEEAIYMDAVPNSEDLVFINFKKDKMIKRLRSRAWGLETQMWVESENLVWEIGVTLPHEIRRYMGE